VVLRTVCACTLLTVLAACTPPVGGPREESSARRGSSTPTVAPEPAVTPEQQRLWPARGSSPFPVLPRTISLDDVAGATPLNVAPIPRAVVVMGSDPRGLFSTGALAAMSTGGEWRLLTAEHLGVSSHLDTAFELSADGTKVFVMDDARRDVVIVTLSTAKVQRFDLHSGMGVPVGWKRDGDRILFTSDSGDEIGWAMSARSGRTVRTRLGGRYASEGPHGRNVALRASAGGLTELESWGGDTPAHRIPLPTSLPEGVSVARTWQRNLIVDTAGDNPDDWAPLAGPVLLLSPSTGQLSARLATPLPHVKWLQSMGEVAQRWVILDVWDRTNVRSLVAWDYERKVLRPVISGQPSGQRFSLALDLLQESASSGHSSR
jgi:hypothetical protein